MIVLLFLALLATDPPAEADARATALRAQARTALGGESTLAPVHALSLQGHFHRMPPPEGAASDAARPARGSLGREAEGDLDVDLVLPDKMRVEASVSRAGAPSFTLITGLSGTQAWMGTEGAPGFGRGSPRTENDAAGPAGRRPTEDERRAALGRRMQGELERMRLGLFADPGPGASATYAGQAESPDGRADVLDVTTSSGAKARLFLDAATHLPLMVTYQDAVPARRPRRPPSADGAERPEETPAPAPAAALTPAAPRMVEGTLFLSDHRAVNGLQLPHRISRAVDGKVVDEWEITRWRVNPTFKPERFEKQ
jgi:hypothetical protein